MDVLCVGMPRAASTWQYDVVSHLIEKHRNGRRLGFLPGEQYESEPPAGDAWRVLKAHDSHSAFAAALTDGRACAVYCYRDLRDVVYSLVHKFGTSFEDVVEDRRAPYFCRANFAFWTAQPSTLSQRYEEIVEDPAGGVTELAEHLGLSLAAGEAEAVAAEYSLKANLWRTVELTNQLRQRGVDLADPHNALVHDGQTLLHWNHIREGKRGAWKDQATPGQLARLAHHCGDWLVEQGYEHGPDWWRERLEELPAEEARRERVAAHNELLELQGQVRELRKGLADAEAELFQLRYHRDRAVEFQAWATGELERTRAHAADLRAVLGELEALGPAALHLARRFNALSTRLPWLSAVYRRTVGRL